MVIKTRNRADNATCKKKSTEHIVAFKPNVFWNIDIFDLSKFDKYKQEITKLNIDKLKSKNIQSDLLPGEKVRLLEKNFLRKVQNHNIQLKYL